MKVTVIEDWLSLKDLVLKGADCALVRPCNYQDSDENVKLHDVLYNTYTNAALSDIVDALYEDEEYQRRRYYEDYEDNEHYNSAVDAFLDFLDYNDIRYILVARLDEELYVISFDDTGVDEGLTWYFKAIAEAAHDLAKKAGVITRVADLGSIIAEKKSPTKKISGFHNSEKTSNEFGDISVNTCEIEPIKQPLFCIF